MKEWDVVVIGGGVAGLTAGIYLKRSNLKAVVMERGMPGGILNNIHRIDNYPGIPKISGPNLAMNILMQAQELGVDIEEEDVSKVERTEKGFLIHGYEDHFAKAVIIATGMSSPSSKIPGEEEFLGRGVSYCATCDGAFYKGKNVALLGGNDRVLEDALYLAGIASNVHLFVPSDPNFSFSLLQECSSLSNFHLHSHGDILKISGDAKVDSILVKEGADTHSLPIDGVFPMKEGVSASGFLNGLSPEKEKQFLVVDEDMMTSIPGIFACGDVVKKKLRQIVNAAGEAAVAASMAIRYVRSH